jgi:hypothetical protein
MTGLNGKLPVIGSSDMIDYFVQYTDAIDLVSRGELAHKPHVFFVDAHMLHEIGDARLEAAPNSARALLTDHKKARGDNEHYAIAFDYSPEGPCFNEATAPHFIALHNLLTELDIPSDKVFFLQHNRLLIGEHTAYAWWCRRNGVKPMRMRYAQWWVLKQAAMFNRRFASPEAFGLHMDRLRRSWSPDQLQKTHKYLCFNYFPRFQRVMILAWLMEQNLLSDGLVSFPGFQVPEIPGHDFMYDALASLNGWRMNDRLKPYLGKLAAMSPLRVDSDEKSDKEMLLDQFVDEPHLKTVFSIVTETDFSSGYLTKRATEKFLKASLHMHPFIQVAEPFSLDEIRGFGFETFEPFFDESYDRIRDPEARLEKIGAAVRDKCQLSMPDLIADARLIMPVLERNVEYCAHDFWDHVRQESEFALLHELNDAIRFPDRAAPEPAFEPRPMSAGIAGGYEIRLPVDLTETIVHGAHMSFETRHDNGRDYVSFGENDTFGNHCALLRAKCDGKSSGAAPFSLRFAAQARNVERMMIDIKGSHQHHFRATFDFKLGILLECANIDGKSTIECAVDYEGDEWFRFSFAGPLAHEDETLDIILYLGTLDFVYKGRSDSEIRLADLALRYRKIAEKPSVVASTHVIMDNTHLGIFDGEGHNIKIRVHSALMRWPTLYRIARQSYRKIHTLRTRLRA